MSTSNRKLALMALGGLLIVCGAFVAGTLVADDSSEVESLKSELGDARAELDEEASLLEAVESESETAEEERDNVADQLAAEQDLNGASPIPVAVGSAPKGDYVIGAAGTVGEFTMEPTLEEVSSSEGEARWVATITVKNNGSGPAELFCGDSGAALIDSSSRTYGAGAVVVYEGSANCGDAIQPGLTIDNFKMEFKLPSDAEPALLELSAGEYGEGPTKGWTVAR
jgi:hypothetical protein